MAQLNRNRYLLFGCLFCNLLLFPAMLVWNVSAQSGPLSTVTPDPGQQGMNATQQAQINDLNRQVETLSKASEDQRFKTIEQNLEKQMWIIASIAAGISGVATLVGWNSYKEVKTTVANVVRSHIDEYWVSQGEKEMNERIMNFDPSSLVQVKLRSTLGMKQVADILQLTGIKHIDWYQKFDGQCLRGIVVVPIKKIEDEQEFLNFMTEYQEQLFYNQVAFIFYTINNYRLTTDIMYCYENIAIANLPISVKVAIHTLSRGMRQKDS